MDTFQQQFTFDRKNIRNLVITTTLYIITIALGIVAFLVLPDVSRLLVLPIVAQNPDASITQTRGMVSTARNVSTILGGIALLAIFFGGMEFHFRNKGTRRSYRIFAWTIGIEIAIILIHQVLLLIVLT